jgi:zinc/manganese transport system permease protein
VGTAVWQILLPALLAGLLVIATHVPLGREVLRRGIIFMDLATAQIAGLGVIVAYSLGWETHGWMVQVAAVSAALAGTLLLYVMEKVLPTVQEAVIGVVFIAAASAAMVLLASNPQGGEHLKELLVGQILWVDYQQLVYLAVLYTLVLLAWVASRGHRLADLVFYLLFAITVTASVQLVGVYLVFASLILPSLAVYFLPRPRQLPVACLVGLAGYLFGLLLAAYYDLPAGPVIILLLTMLAGLLLLLSRPGKQPAQ